MLPVVEAARSFDSLNLTSRLGAGGRSRFIKTGCYGLTRRSLHSTLLRRVSASRHLDRPIKIQNRRSPGGAATIGPSGSLALLCDV